MNIFTAHKRDVNGSIEIETVPEHSRTKVKNKEERQTMKVMKDILVKKLGVLDFPLGSPRGTLQQAFQNGIIDDDGWMLKLKDSVEKFYGNTN